MIQIVNAKLDNDFDNPLGLLSDCHRRIEKFLEQLLRVTQTAKGGVLHPEQREAMATALRYFSHAAPMHTADEETSLFPRLRELAQNGNAIAQSALDVIDRLEADHAAADVRHAVIDEIGTRWLDASTLDAPDVERLENELTQLRAFYAAHIKVEDTELFPLAGTVLAEDTTETIGREMAGRRGLDFDNLPAGNRCAQRRAAAAKNN
jgi:hemerythrin-like domain-containing protein